MSDLNINEAKKQFSETISYMRSGASYLTELVECGQISVSTYKRLMWERFGISPNCIVEGVTYQLNIPNS